MKRIAWSLAALLAAAPAVLAQDAPAPKSGETPAAPAAPARHENVVTEAAKAAFEAMEKAMSSPLAQGLKDFQGTIEMKMETMGRAGMSMSVSVGFKAPRDLKVWAKDEKASGPAFEQLKEPVKGIVLNALGLYMPSGDDEFDADIVTENGKKVLVWTTYSKTGTQTLRFGIGDDGMPTVGTFTAKEKMPGGMEMDQKGKFSWVFEKDGDLNRLQKQVFEVESPMAMKVEYVVSYSDAGGFKMPTKFVVELMGTKIGYRFTDLTVNGKKVELGADAKAPAKEGGEAKPPAKAPPGKDGMKEGGEGGKDEDGEEGEGGEDDEGDEEHEGMK